MFYKLKSGEGRVESGEGQEWGRASGEGQEWGRASGEGRVGKGEWGRASWAGAGAVGEEEWLNFRDCLHQICVSHSHSAFPLPHSCPSPLLPFPTTREG